MEGYDGFHTVDFENTSNHVKYKEKAEEEILVWWAISTTCVFKP